MALCTTALRRWLIDHDALPEHPLVASIPVSVRTPEQFGTAGNQISFMLTALPTDEADPARRLGLLHTSLAGAKRRFSATPARLLHVFSAALPQAMHGLASRAVLRAATISGPPFNLFVSNVAGPQVPLYAAGARVTGNYPVSVVSDIGGGINITVMSYDGHLDFGIVVCRDMVPDVWDIARHLRDALTELTEVTGRVELESEPMAAQH
jgi:WS/DGAT/MGAT family acyltransferase